MAVLMAGLRVGDVVTSVGSARITGTESLLATVRSAAPGSTVEIGYQRDGQPASAKGTLGAADVQA